VLMSRMWEIVMYRLCQYWGSFKGNREQRKLSHTDKEIYFYPSTTPSLSNSTQTNGATHRAGALSHEIMDGEMDAVQVPQTEIGFVVPTDRFPK